MEAISIRKWGCVVGLSLLFAAPAVGAQAIGIPDAPAPEENLIAHHTYEFPSGFVTSDGRRFPRGSYALALIESGGRYYLRLIHVETRQALRLEGRATGSDGAGSAVPATRTEVSIRSEKSGNSLLFTCGDFTAAFPLRALHKTG